MATIPTCPVGTIYTEESARAKLQRHRDRGDYTRCMMGCGDHWHIGPRICGADAEGVGGVVLICTRDEHHQGQHETLEGTRWAEV